MTTNPFFLGHQASLQEWRDYLAEQPESQQKRRAEAIVDQRADRIKQRLRERAHELRQEIAATEREVLNVARDLSRDAVDLRLDLEQGAVPVSEATDELRGIFATINKARQYTSELDGFEAQAKRFETADPATFEQEQAQRFPLLRNNFLRIHPEDLQPEPPRAPAPPPAPGPDEVFRARTSRAPRPRR